MQEVELQKQQKSQSFYSIDDSRTSFTFIQGTRPQQMKQGDKHIFAHLGIKQSSALQQGDISQIQIQRSMQTIIPSQEQTIQVMNVNDISQINHNESINELECSVCLQKQIDCLTVSNQPSPQQVQQLNSKIDRLKQDQSMLKKQIQIFQGLVSMTKNNSEALTKEIIQTNNFMKKKCQHLQQSSAPFNVPWPDHNQITIKTLRQSNSINSSSRRILKHYDIKPSVSRSAAQSKINSIYKSACFGNHIVLIDDPQNQYRIQVFYQKETVTIEVINYSRGETNFVYAAKLNEETGEENQRISEKLVYPLRNYVQKKFTLSLNILLLLFSQNKQKQQKNILKIQQIRTVSVPLPLSCFIQNRLQGISDRQKIIQRIIDKMYTYQIDINYNADVEYYGKLKQLIWVRNEWISLKGSCKLLRVQMGELSGKQNEQRVVFRISVKEKDTQQAIDIIEYLCFMLSL